MYLFFGIFFLILLAFFCINHWRRKRNIKKVCCMCMNEKCELLNDLIEPLGYCYQLSQDLFTTRTDAWQREFGYCALYDKAAAGFNMVFDCLPVYFDYQDRTWLIEFWKGQYGINTGCEIGVYYADGIVEEDKLKSTLFDCVEDKDMQKLCFTLSEHSERLAHMSGRHWWLTAFLMGRFSKPSELCMSVQLTFPNCEMATAFIKGLAKAGYSKKDYCVSGTMVTFSMKDTMPAGFLCRLQRKLAQLSNRLWCKVYLFVTRPFRLSIDRLLYLYFYLPFAFRRMLRLKRFKKHKRKRG